MDTYTVNLNRFERAMEGATIAAVTSLDLQRYLTGLRDTMQPVTVHQHFRCLRTFFRWCVDAGLLPTSPMSGITMRAPRTLPRVPEDSDVQRLTHRHAISWRSRQAGPRS